jgi:MEDS: MEthanogen/methylotroph, DcmR Sensory domain
LSTANGRSILADQGLGVHSGINDPTAAAHWVQFFDDVQSRSETVASFLHDGLDGGATLLIVETKEHWQATARLLAGRRVPIEAAAQSGQLTVLDGADAMTLVGGADGLGSERFDRSIGALVRQLASRAPSLCVYGEVVDLLAKRGDFDAALRLETLWNALIAQVPMTLLCGYSAPRYREPGRSEEFQRICGAHTHRRLSTGDTIAIQQPAR